MRIAALLQTSVPVQSRPMFVNSRTVIASPSGRAARRRGRGAGHHAVGHLLSVDGADWMPAAKTSGVVSDQQTTASNQPADIGFVTVVHLRHGVQPLAEKRKRALPGSPEAR